MVLWKCLLLFFTIGCCYSARIKTVGYEQKNPAAQQLHAYVPSSLAAGELPTHAMVHFQFPEETYEAYDAKTHINLGLGTIEAAVPSVNEAGPGWTPFVPHLFKWSVTRWNIFAMDNRKAGPHPQILPLNNWNSVILPTAGSTGVYACHTEAGTDEAGKTLLAVLKGRLGTKAAGGSMSATCWYASGDWVTMWIPMRFLTPNPDFPDARVTMMLSMVDRDWDRRAFKDAGHLPVAISAAVPYTVSAPEVYASSLLFLKFVPSTTIHGVQLNWVRVTFIPGVEVLAGGVVAIMAQAPIFQDIPQTLGLTLPPIIIGYGNCNGDLPSPFCCHASTGYTRVSNGLFGYDSSESDSNELHTGGYSTLSINLAPAGCSLPQGRPITFVIPQSYLGNNPSLIDPTGPMSYSYAFRVVNVRLGTSAEAEFVSLQRYSLPNGPFYTSTVESYTDLSSAAGNPGGHAFAPFRYGADPYSMYIIGTSTVSAFYVSVDTLTTDLVPTWIKIGFSLSTDWVYPTGGTPPNLPYTPQRILIQSNQGVFRPGQGSIEQPLAIGNGGFLPVQCAGATYFTSPYSSLVITPNPRFDLGCNDVMTAGQIVSFTLPGTVLLPNPAAGTVVTFDIRIIPTYSVPDYVDSDINSDGVTRANTVDGATLMDVIGYTTVAVCGLQPYASGRLYDLASMATVDRCVLVASLSTLSPVSTGILQCNSGLGLVTYVKYSESEWHQAHWPWTNVASQGNWAQLVGTAPRAYIYSWGYMVTIPMFAVAVSYPPTVSTLQLLGVNPNVPEKWTIAFIVRLDRLTLSCQMANNNNPWRLQVWTTATIVEVYLFVDSAVLGAAGKPVMQIPGSAWGQGNGIVFVTLAHGGAVVGYTTPIVSPAPTGDDSDDALFGLLALIAVPLLLLCCLAALLWFLRPKAEPCPGCPEYPVQEMYWVNAQPAAPVYMVEPCASQAMVSAPPTTPIYLVQ